ncbi:MAG TPA: CheR family methyltransferase, partial [Spirochaetia bacterium]
RLLDTATAASEIEKLARHLTVGETYFFRDKDSFDALQWGILPDLIRSRAETGRWLRIWSAGCCTGEEPYSVAMLLDQLLPDIDRWNVTILATDINTRFLRSAAEGVFREWSFRATPPAIRERYFSPESGGRMRISPRIRRMVRFTFVNLVSDEYPSLLNNTNAMDVVLCRNVLMYFAPEQAARVVAGLRRSLVDNGWLLVAPSESSQASFGGFSVVPRDLTFLYRKAPEAPPSAADAAPSRGHDPRRGGAGQMALSRPSASAERSERDRPPIEIAREHANRGELEKALVWCDTALALDGLSPQHRFLRAMIERELGRLVDAAKSLEQALYLDADFVMAHFVLGTLAERLGHPRKAQRHLRIAEGLLARMPSEEPIPEGAGLNAGRLADVIRLAKRGGAE